ncbi:ABC transporter substrate-binding protein [Bogoriella caseilytica]|uniref:Carbohydrate ABC transporter substrate-binding protein (CUT1 family) n=1 Tax=Bogoriella caseilytica TaxID=56055 RepID=A0A3N2BBK6_9MICO|nr:ABC transporter substrate-binding protein [Bogoriella caseilytica]ROR72646.1 carbohydrate ABC transporter substrate-binding protein (CUT1 family) [Bogoriella caseilytica]
MRITRSRRTAAVAAVVTGALLLAACGGPDTSGGNGSEDGGNATGDVADGGDAGSDGIDWSEVEPADSIVFATNHPGGSADVEAELIEQFTEETGIEVEVVTSGANYEETQQWFLTGGGSGADVIVLSDATWFLPYLNDMLVPADDVLEAAEVDVSGYVEALYEDYLYEGYHYGVPYARSTPLFYYNVEFYEELGIDSPPETWEEVAEISQQIVDAGLAQSGFAFPPQDQYPAWALANLVWGEGGGWSDEWDFSILTSDATVEALEFAQSGVGEWANVAATAQQDDFASGVAGQTIQSTGSLGGILEAADFEVGTAFLPTGAGGDENVVPTGGAGLMIASASSPDVQLAAAMFAGHMTSAESQATFSAATGYVPSHQDADMSEVYADNPLFETAVDQLERTRVQDFARLFLPGGDLELAQTLQQILTSDVDVRGEMERVEAQFEDLYDQELASELD